MYEKVIKRMIDIVLSFLGLLLLSWLFILIALIIVIDDPGTPFFTQKRVCRGKGTFLLFNVSGIARYESPPLPSAA